MNACDYEEVVSDYTTEKSIAVRVMHCIECSRKIDIGDEYVKHSYLERKGSYYSTHPTHVLCNEAYEYMYKTGICLPFSKMLYVTNEDDENVFDTLASSDALFRDKFAMLVRERARRKRSTRKLIKRVKQRGYINERNNRE